VSIWPGLSAGATDYCGNPKEGSTMSRTSGSHFRRPLAAAGVLALVGLATPATATHAQNINPERAPLNPTPVISYRLVRDTPGPWRTLDGERALLGRY
jgi:hypothetical protein